MGWLLKIDDWLLDRVFQHVVDWVSRRWGLHFLTLGEFLITGALLCWWITTGVRYFFTGMSSLTIGSAVIGLALSTVYLWIVQTARNVNSDRFINAFNTMRWRAFGTRMGNLFAMPLYFMGGLELPVWSERGFSLLLICGLYILSCQAGPPRRQRVYFKKDAYHAV